LNDHPASVRRDLEEDIAWKERLLKHHRLPAIFMSRLVAGQARFNIFPATVLQQLLFTAGTGVGDIPKLLVHAHQLAIASASVKPGTRTPRSESHFPSTLPKYPVHTKQRPPRSGVAFWLFKILLLGSLLRRPHSFGRSSHFCPGFWADDMFNGFGSGLPRNFGSSRCSTEA
jgi:hypothetical protein